jgi:hypothetical protein
VPPHASTKLKLKLPPNVWFHGSQSTKTGGRSVQKLQAQVTIAWLAHIIRCVLRTPFGRPVEPDVSRILPTVSGPIAARRRSTSGPAFVATQSARRSAPAAGALVTRVRPRRSSAASALANGRASATKIRLGSVWTMIPRSFSWSCDISE